MLVQYPAMYRDAQGAETTTIDNDGKQLRMCVRGVEFVGHSFDAFAPLLPRESPQRASFPLTDLGELCSCRLVCEIPLPIVANGEMIQGQLHVHLELSDPLPLPGIDPARRVQMEAQGYRVSAQRVDRDLRLRVSFGGASFEAPGNVEDFEWLYSLQRGFPPGVSIQACINCAFSDYSPAGKGMFGELMCFRGNKAAYRRVTTKDEFFALIPTMTERVQETYLCPEFEQRRPGTGYRG